MSLTREQHLTFCAAVELMNERQLDYCIRIFHRLSTDSDFSARFDRDREMIALLLRSEDYRALDRWFSRGLLRLAKSNHGSVQLLKKIRKQA